MTKPPLRRMTLLTHRRFHPTCLSLIRACAAIGLELRPSHRIEPGSAAVLQWGFDDPVARAAVRAHCAHHGIPFLNPRVMGKWSQYQRLLAHQVPTPPTAFAGTLQSAEASARMLGYPVVLKPLFGLQSRNVQLARDVEELRARWSPRHRLVQQYVPEGGRCARLFVVGDRVEYAVTRVAKDGFHATYAHGRRGRLEPFPESEQAHRVAVAACRALGLDIAGVDVVLTPRGPVVLEVNHRVVEFTDRALHGRNAVRAVAQHLRHVCDQAAAKGLPGIGAGTFGVITSEPQADSTVALKAALERRGLRVVVQTRVTPGLTGCVLWRLGEAAHALETRRARAMALPVENPAPPTLWLQRGRLYRAGLAVPRTRRTRSLLRAMRLAGVVGYPFILRPVGSGAARGRLIHNRRELMAAWAPDWPHLLEEFRGAGTVIERVCVAGPDWSAAERAVGVDWAAWAAGGPGGAGWKPVLERPAAHELARKALDAVGLRQGVVEFVPEPDAPTVVCVRSLDTWSGPQARAATHPVALALSRSVDLVETPVNASSEPPAPPFAVNVVMARSISGRGSGWRIWNIYSIYRELLRRQPSVPSLRGRPNRDLAATADLILQDPWHAFGFGRRGDRLNRWLLRNAPERSHLLRLPRPYPVADKRRMARVAARLGLRVPRVFGSRRAALAALPVISKPRAGTQGVGVRLLRTAGELRRTPARHRILQEYIDSGTGYAVSLRLVTVRDRVAAGALFYHRDSVRSNLARGGRALALTGPGRLARANAEESWLLRRLRLDPARRAVPVDVAKMASEIGRYYSQIGVQMLGQDYVVDGQGNWYFLEVNLPFGIAAVNVTDGDGFPNGGRGARYAGKLLLTTLEAQLEASRRARAAPEANAGSAVKKKKAPARRAPGVPRRLFL